MNILFIFSIQKSLLKKKPLKGQEDIQIGIAQLSSVLKMNNHSTDLLVLDQRNGKHNYKLIEEKFVENRFDLIALSSVYSEFLFVKEIASFIKNRYKKFTVLGGVHATISPEESYLDIFDALCIGEGGNAILELANKIEANENIYSIPNLWLKKDGSIIKNPTQSFIQDLDSLPFVDRDLWQPYIFDKNTRLTLLLGRGCPYNCTYCCNHSIRRVAEGQYVRLRSPQNIVAELEILSIKFPSISDYFLEVETLGADLDWLVELCDNLYEFNKNRATKLTFSSNLRVYDNLNLDLVFENLKKANFVSLTIGLESGNERIREKILNRRYSNETIYNAAKFARKHGIKLGLFNLIGLPTESYQDFLDTLRMNQDIQPDWHATSIFFPYKGTKLYEMSEKLGLLPDKLNYKNERQQAILDLPNFNKRMVQRQFDSFHYNVYKKAQKKSLIKLALFILQIWLGHNFMANTKNKLSIILHQMKIKNNLVKNIQVN